MSESKPNRLTTLQLYFPSASRARVTRFWHRLSPPALAQHLLRVATAAKIEQVILRTVTAGYLGLLGLLLAGIQPRSFRTRTEARSKGYAAR